MHYMQYIETACVHTSMHSTTHSVYVCMFVANAAFKVMQSD